MNKKGFTLVELLATIAIVALISGIATVSVTTIIKSSKKAVFETYENTMHAQAIEVMIEALSDPTKANLYPSVNGSTTLTLPMLEIDDINNPINKDDLCSGSYVSVTRNVVNNINSFTYEVCLICPNSNYNALGNDCKIFEN